MAVLQEFKCPCCGGTLAFDSGLQKMKCPYCDTEIEVEALTGATEDLSGAGDDMHWDASDNQWQDGELDGLRVYICESCGGEIVGDETLGATTCPYCGNRVVMKKQFSGALRPDCIIPFKLDKRAAKEALKNHYKGKRLLPTVFKDENHIDEVKGIYVPFWLFDADADAQLQFDGTRTRFWSDGDYDYTETSYYAITRNGSLGFQSVPVDGSSKMADDLMDSIEPFDLSEAVDFQTAYLAGYLADKYDVDAEQSKERANQRIKQSTEDLFATTVTGFDTVTPTHTDIQLKNGSVRYALFPVWLLNTTWNGEKYTFAMNGQTGKLVGDLPCDKGKWVRRFLGLTAVCTAVAYAGTYLLWLM